MNISKIFFIAVFILVASESAFAYLDPATGSILVQIIIGVVASSLFTIKLYWKKIKRFFGIGSNKIDNSGESDK